MLSRSEVKTQIERLNLMFRSRHVAIQDGKENRKYLDMLEVYINAFQPFSSYELEAGVTACLETFKGPFWPTCAELRKFCLEVHRESREQRLRDDRDQKCLPPPSEEFSEEHKARLAGQYARLRQAYAHGHADGTRYGKINGEDTPEQYEKDRAWVYDGQPAGQQRRSA